MMPLVLVILIAGGVYFNNILKDDTKLADCGDITIANMNWASAQAIAEIDKIILTHGYNCNVELVPGDTVPTFTSMNEKGEPDVAPELWSNSLRIPLDVAKEEGRLIASDVFSQGGEEGWFIPEATLTANPELKTWEDVIARPDLFPNPENPDRGALVGCPAGWACQIINQNLYKAYGMEAKGWDLIDPGSSAGLDALINKAVNDGDNILSYYWAPTAILGKLPMYMLEPNVDHDKSEWETCTGVADCADPKVNAWGFSYVETVVTDNFAKEASVGLDYITNRSFGNATLNTLLAWMADNQATGEEAAIYYLQNNQDDWSGWVSKDVKKAVLAAL
ncbi:MAG: ABC transporter substrate-binding protein [Rhodobiaceae bacterium]|uniref:ABC transporter substrate-binding protein n=1 Tax=PS1 clade bacterium TaxID=2175152 RepID=A0A368DSJ3_9PROT|nr:ABC transporter substrate-binding protein [Rhodobiaceae bacterium]OUT73826.1 MAG: ABC transporter substrate-binding protein [Rhizobiales bacterium TMED25]RCL74195.1 MAG: ABC transporter substrate-binding protein [PS1 clade bacterium]